MRAEELKSHILPILLAGTRRESSDRLMALGASRENAVLNALSLAGQSLRFTRPPIPSQLAVESWPRDERRIVPDPLRPLLFRLLDRSTDNTARAVALALDSRKLRLHPFDLPKLDGFARRYSELLGATAQYWVRRETPARAARGYFEADELTDETWSEGELRARVKFLKALRKREPEGARTLLEKSWPRENPESRLQLLATIETSLSLEDRPFLESIQKDRAPRVRSIAQRLVAILSGTSGDHPAIRACMERLEKTQSGLFKKKTRLKLELPATVKEHETNRWIEEKFSEVSLDGLASGCEMPVAGLLEAAEEDENLLFALALISSREGRVDLLGAITDLLPDAWARMSTLNWENGLERGLDERADWARALVKPGRWLPEVPFPAWSWLHRQMEGPLPEKIMSEILDSRVWKEPIEAGKTGGSELVQVICALCPRELRERVRADLAPVEVERRDKGWMLLEILDTLEGLR